MDEICVFGAENKFASTKDMRQSKENIKKISEWLKFPDKILILYGDYGCGKSYACSAICNFLRSIGKNIRAFNEDRYFAHLRNVISHHHDPIYEIDRISRADYVIIDDIGKNRPTDWQQDMLQYIIDLMKCGPLIVTTNLTPYDFKEKFNGRLVSRLFSINNILCDFGSEDRRRPII